MGELLGRTEANAPGRTDGAPNGGKLHGLELLGPDLDDAVGARSLVERQHGRV